VTPWRAPEASVNLGDNPIAYLSLFEDGTTTWRGPLNPCEDLLEFTEAPKNFSEMSWLFKQYYHMLFLTLN
jgi:hypothetical protein